ncbi:MAG: MarR family transcriptional regulator, partial [Gemmatimonadetes bacterium]|nr:MarR family transcriptional regulator [Gemmatimonadota bacterium]
MLTKTEVVTVGELQKSIGILPAQMSRLLRGLEDKSGTGLVASSINPQDRRKVDVTITDDGAGCDDPEILRTVGSTTSDLHRELRGRFGHGLIDFICLCETVEIVTLRNRLVFDAKGCDVNVKRKAFPGLTLTATFRHDGEGFDDLARYFACLILPDGVKFGGSLAKVARFDAKSERLIVNGSSHPKKEQRHLIPAERDAMLKLV